MLAVTLTCALLMQQPIVPSWVATGVDHERPTATVVRGTAELNPAQAYETAHREALSRLRERCEVRAEEIIQEVTPAWLPAFITEKEVRRWLARMDLDEGLKILDRADRERQHDFGLSYQTSLLVREKPSFLSRAERRLGQQLRRAEKTFLMRSGATLGLWMVLALGVFWLDRLSRGYMTGRLSLLALAIGAGAPVVLFLV